jgi:hypothetical protein
MKEQLTEGNHSVTINSISPVFTDNKEVIHCTVRFRFPYEARYKCFSFCQVELDKIKLIDFLQKMKLYRKREGNAITEKDILRILGKALTIEIFRNSNQQLEVRWWGQYEFFRF